MYIFFYYFIFFDNNLIKNLKKAPVFIFVTAFTEFAAESFNLNVIDYIVKPASFERILKAVNKAIDLLDAKQTIEKNNSNDQYTKTVNADDYFFIKENTNRLGRLYTNRIIRWNCA